MTDNRWSYHLDLSARANDFTSAFELFFQAYVDPHTGVVYDAPISDALRRADDNRTTFTHTDIPAALLPIQPRPDLGPWPTPDEIAASVPTVNGWDTAIENAPAEGASLLAGLCRNAFNLTDDRRRDCIDHLYKGLISLWLVPGRTGFICRGYLPHSRAFYRQTSFDQLPIYVLGLFEYARSPYCSDNHRHEIAECVQSILHWLQSHDWRLTLHADPRPTPHSNCRSLDPAQITKLFAMLLMTARLTGDVHWSNLYRTWRDEDAGKKLHAIARRDKTWEPYQLMYFAITLSHLAALDDDERCRSFYDEQRRLLMHPLALFCSRHVYAQFQPTLPEQARTIHAHPNPLPDFRVPLARTLQHHPFEPNTPRFWWSYRDEVERHRAERGSLSHDWLTLDYFAITAAHRAIMHDWPTDRPYPGADRTRRTLEGFYARLCLDHPLRFLPKLALALANPPIGYTASCTPPCSA